MSDITLSKMRWLTLVDGYIREKLQKKRKQLIVPNELHQLIHGFCYVVASMAFYQKKYGSHLKCIDNNKIVKTTDDKKWSTCLFNSSSITSAMCDQFVIEYTWISGWWIHPGYITSSIKQSITDWQVHLGRIPNNVPNSFGILINVCDKQYHFYNKDSEVTGSTSKYKSKTGKFKNGDRFTFVFDFTSHQCTIYHNDNKADVLELPPDSIIIPGIALYWKSSVKITKWELGDNAKYNKSRANVYANGGTVKPRKIKKKSKTKKTKKSGAKKGKLSNKNKNKAILTSNESVEKLFKLFLKRISMQKYFDKFKENECSDMDSIALFDDEFDEILQNDIGIKSPMARKKLIKHGIKVQKEMDEFQNNYGIKTVLYEKLAKYGIVTIHILCDEIQNKRDLKNKFDIKDEKQCDFILNVVKTASTQ